MVETRRSKRLSDKVPSSSAAVSSDDDDFQPVIRPTRRTATRSQTGNSKRTVTRRQTGSSKRVVTRSQVGKNKRAKTEHGGDLKKVKEEDSFVPTIMLSDTDQDDLASEDSKEGVKEVNNVVVEKEKEEQPGQADQDDDESQDEEVQPSRSPSVDDVKSESSRSPSVDDVKSEPSRSPSVDDVKAEPSHSSSVENTKSETSPSPSGTSDSLLYNSEFDEEATVASSQEQFSSDEEDSSDNEAALGSHHHREGNHGGNRRGNRGRSRSRGRGDRRFGTYTPSTQRRFAHNYERTRFKVHEHHKELESVWTDLEKREQVEVEPIEQPSFLKLNLLPFQKVGVAWMIQQEQNPDFNGGILADEMGMGKTIQTISLLLSDGKGPNLVVAPTVAIVQWKREIETHTNTDVKVHIFHGAKRANTTSELKKFDVILTTFSIMETAFRRQEYGFKRQGQLVKEKSPLHQIDWHRIILDEAHNIKDRGSNTARSVFNLSSNYRWSLTGTPLQNRVGELYSLIRFMQADPYAYYYCTDCDCKSLNWKFTDKKGCDHCGHTPMHHVCWWNNEVLKPIQVHGYVGAGKEALDKLRLLLDRIMLRRTKIQCADDLGLPPKNVIVRRDFFSDEEEDVYRSLYSDVARQFTTFVEAGTVLNNYANIFELLTKMRQCADHPDLITKKTTDNKQLVCMLCNEPPEDPIAASCKHIFCRECCTQYYNSFDDSTGQRVNCPSCFAQFSVDLYQPALEIEQAEGANSNYSKTSIVNRINMDKWRSSTKIEALYEELSHLRREDKTIKSIVFSQFVNFLDLCNWRLSRAGFECVRLDGSMSPTQRDDAINYFMTKPTATVFLISLKAGGVALNLTEASRVFICDPWWNPAMDRIHRLGQHRPIRVTRLVIENSIESRIVQLQEKKSALVDSTVGHNSEALDKLTVEDLRFLFVM